MNVFDRLTFALASAIRRIFGLFWSIPGYAFRFFHRCRRSIQPVPMNQPETDDWRGFYVAATLETDFERLPEHILLTQAAIQQRLASRVPLDTAEQLAIRDALNGITALRQSMTSGKPDEKELHEKGRAIDA